MSPSYRALSSPRTPSRPAPPPPPPALPLEPRSSSPKAGDSGASSLLSHGAVSSTSSGYHSEEPAVAAPVVVVDAQTGGRRSSSTMGNVTEEELTLTFDGDSDEDHPRSASPPKPHPQVSPTPNPTRTPTPHQSQSPHLIYKEYYGEDFSKYLQDDTDEVLQRQQQMTDKRYRKRQVNDYDSTIARGKAGLKEKLSKVFTLSRPPKNHGRRTSSNIHNFSYVDSKSYLTPVEVGGLSDTCSDLGGTQNNNWWGTDTLSARSLRAHSDITPRKSLATSEPNLTQLTEEDSAGAGASKGAGGKKKGGLWGMFTNKRNKKNVTPPPSRDDVYRDGLPHRQNSCDDIRL